jgi:hypothetical protein
MTDSVQKSEPVSVSSSGPATIDRLSQQVKFGHQAWMERLKEMQAVETEFTRELLATRDPSAALKVCNRWMAKRLELLTSDSKAFTGFWMDLVMTAAGGAPAAGNPPAKSEDT